MSGILRDQLWFELSAILNQIRDNAPTLEGVATPTKLYGINWQEI